MPFVGEAADAYKTAKLGAKIADKASDIYKASKTVDRIYDVVTNPEVQKALKATSAYGECLVDGFIVGESYVRKGDSFAIGFSNGFSSSLISELINNKFRGDEKKKKVIGNTVGSALGKVIEETLVRNNSNVENIISEIAKSTASGILSGVGSSYLKSVIDIANEADSAAQTLMKYDEITGKALKFFFDRLIIA